MALLFLCCCTFFICFNHLIKYYMYLKKCSKANFLLLKHCENVNEISQLITKTPFFKVEKNGFCFLIYFFLIFPFQYCPIIPFSTLRQSNLLKHLKIPFLYVRTEYEQFLFIFFFEREKTIIQRIIYLIFFIAILKIL